MGLARKPFAFGCAEEDPQGMRVTFFRIPDHQRGSALVARDDGVVYRLDGGPITAALPHDLVHLTVEDSLGMADGIWGAIAGGVVFRSMTHVSGRRPPHAAQRSAELIRAHRQSLQHAELIGGFVERLAHAQVAGDPQTMRRYFATAPGIGLDPAAVRHAVDRLHEAEAQWRALPVGGRLTCHWPSYRRLSVARPVRAGRAAQSRRSRDTASSSTSSRLQNAKRISRRPAS
jgi:hypothetical protein